MSRNSEDIADCQLPIADWPLLVVLSFQDRLLLSHKSAIGNRQSAIGNWQSAIGNRQSAIFSLSTL
jgi:hypothetical protein